MVQAGDDIHVHTYRLILDTTSDNRSVSINKGIPLVSVDDSLKLRRFEKLAR